MLELLTPLKTCLDKSTLKDFDFWFKDIPERSSWYVISDYCFGDSNKSNDVVTFSVLLHHDTFANIKEYIRSHAPKDLKKTRSLSKEFIQYINAPVIYHFSFIVDRNTKYMREYADIENMKSFLPSFDNLVSTIGINSPSGSKYFDAVLKRSEAFFRDFSNKNFNAKLARQIYLVSGIASIVFYYLNKTKSPTHIAWVSDRDAIVDRYDGFTFDLAYIMFLAELAESLGSSQGDKIRLVSEPHFKFVVPNQENDDNLDELIRIPDYLAGTLADFNMKTGEFSKEKFYQLHSQSLLGSRNHAIIQVYGNSQQLSAKRIGFK